MPMPVCPCFRPGISLTRGPMQWVSPLPNLCWQLSEEKSKSGTELHIRGDPMSQAFFFVLQARLTLGCVRSSDSWHWGTTCGFGSLCSK